MVLEYYRTNSALDKTNDVSHTGCEEKSLLGSMFRDVVEQP